MQKFYQQPEALITQPMLSRPIHVEVASAYSHLSERTIEAVGHTQAGLLIALRPPRSRSP